MKSKEKLSSMTSVRFDGIYNGKEAEVGHGGCVCLYIYMCMYVCMYICMYVCMYIFSNILVCICIYIYVRIGASISETKRWLLASEQHFPEIFRVGTFRDKAQPASTLGVLGDAKSGNL